MKWRTRNENEIVGFFYPQLKTKSYIKNENEIAELEKGVG